MNTLGGLSALFVCATWFGGWQNGTRPPPNVMPPEPLLASVAPATGVRCRIAANMLERRITVESSYSNGAALEALRSQQITVGYWPTRVLTYGSDKLVVAGRRSNGNTVIELWDVKWPEVQLAPPGNSSPYPKVFTDMVVVGIAEMYDAAVAGRDTVIGITRMFGTSGSEPALLVYFNDSKTLHKLGIGQHIAKQPNATVSWELLAAPTTNGNAHVQSALSDPDRYEWFGLCHSELGFVYSLRNPTSDGPTLVFFDTDRDRKFDSSLLMHDHEWNAVGLDDPTRVLTPTF